MIEIAEPTREEIDLIIFDDEIYGRISDETCPTREEFKIDYEKFEQWIGFYLCGEIIGLAMIGTDGDFHFQILKIFRKYAREALQECLKSVSRNLYCEIPTCFQSVINFAKNNGFKEVGLSDSYFLKNKINHNMVKLTYERS